MKSIYLETLFGLLMLSGCSSLQERTATQIPCPENQIKITQLSGPARAWAAECKGFEYYCKQFPERLRCDEASQIKYELEFEEAKAAAEQKAFGKCNIGLLSPQNATSRTACWNQAIYSIHASWKYPYMELLKLQLEDIGNNASAYSEGRIGKEQFKDAVCRTYDNFSSAIVSSETKLNRSASQIRKDPVLAQDVEKTAITLYRQKTLGHSAAGSTSDCGLYMFDERPH